MRPPRPEKSNRTCAALVSRMEWVVVATHIPTRVPGPARRRGTTTSLLVRGWAPRSSFQVSHCGAAEIVRHPLNPRGLDGRIPPGAVALDSSAVLPEEHRRVRHVPRLLNLRRS